MLCTQFFRVAYSTRFDRAVEEVARKNPSALCFDFDHPDRHRLRTMGDVRTAHPDLPMLMLTADHSEALAVWAFRTGAWNYLVKPISPSELSANLEAIERIRHRAAAPRVADMIAAPIPHELSMEPIDLRAARLHPALLYVKQNFREKLSEAVAASLCGTNRFAFSRDFHAAFGVTFRDFVMRTRIAEARRLLAEGKRSVTDVAYSTGFADGSYFARMFRRYTGALPSEYWDRTRSTLPGARTAPGSPDEPSLQRPAAGRGVVVAP